ncbi:MAG: hypothetical protein P4K92_05155 [Candidatus Nitrosotalea sp.]|nr:hypothetical protein [Candidatus Nitrosotalea sp.]
MSDTEIVLDDESLVFVGNVVETDLLDEFVVLDVADRPLPVVCDDIGMVPGFVVLDNVLLELSVLIEKAYCGKTNIAVNKIKDNNLRFISLYLSNSVNKELLHLVHEHCY